MEPQQAQGDAGGLKGLHRLHLMMGLQCNARCTMCYQTDFSPRYNMPATLWRDRLHDAYRVVKSVKLQGGETTVMRNCREAALYLRAFPNVKISITTNGIFLDELWQETIIRQGELYSVSINAATEAVYDRIVKYGKFRSVLSNLETVLTKRSEKTPAVHMTAVVLPENFNELHKIVELAGQMGVDRVELMYDPALSFRHRPAVDAVTLQLRLCEAQKARFPALALVGLEPLYRRIGHQCVVQQRRKPMCMAPFRNLVIDHDGSVRVCCNTWIRVGNLYQETLDQVWTGPLVARFRQRLEDGNYNWCLPLCTDNAAPSNVAYLNKYLNRFTDDPYQFTRKVLRKLQQRKTSQLSVW
jgi:MoaA/NifB/PqqE/SkfB family radical SAM enzyme